MALVGPSENHDVDDFFATALLLDRAEGCSCTADVVGRDLVTAVQLVILVGPRRRALARGANLGSEQVLPVLCKRYRHLSVFRPLRLLRGGQGWIGWFYRDKRHCGGRGNESDSASKAEDANTTYLSKTARSFHSFCNGSVNAFRIVLCLGSVKKFNITFW